MKKDKRTKVKLTIGEVSEMQRIYSRKTDHETRKTRKPKYKPNWRDSYE